MRATKSADVAKLIKCDTAKRTCLLVQLGKLLRGFVDIKMLSQGPCNGRHILFIDIRLHEIDPCMLLTQMQFFGHSICQFSDVKGCWLFAVLALH